MKKYLLSGKRRQFQMRRLRRNWICMDLAFLILLAVTLMMPPVLRYTKAVAENRDLKSRILILDSENELPEEYERAAECYEHVCKIWELSGAQEMEQEIFSRLLDCWDDRGIYLESLVFEDGRIHLRAETENHEDAVSMVRDLKMQNSISEVYVGAIEKRKTSLSFSITCELADGWGNAKGVCEEYGTVDGQEQTMVDAPDSIAASDTGLAGDCTVPDGADGAIDGRKSQAETGI